MTQVKFEKRLDVNSALQDIVLQQAELQRPDLPLLRKRIIEEIQRVQEMDSFDRQQYLKTLKESNG